MDLKDLKRLAEASDERSDRFNGVATKYLQHYLTWFRYLDSQERENATPNKKNMLVSSCLLTVSETNLKLRRASFSL
ncbi:hypothetical protein skT53_08370 [Effusibacillus dendaii]|uniref:Uncharacterized protein n=1 Tax=Effusibacillus dendaii TaxID=2743772 RepID=A0A7I8D919_9BACL|nr:hypothetical protein skT53_08370 [Effusibacillus dendaii]